MRRCAAALLIALLLAACEPSATSGEPNGRRPDERLARAYDCADRAATAVASEPNYSADLTRWQTWDGCDVRLDFAMTRSGACIRGVTELLIGWPLGRSTDVGLRLYIRDPTGETGPPASRFDGDADLPNTAGDTGLRQGEAELWMIPGEDTFVWLKSGPRVERWPLDRSPIGCGD